MLYYNIYMFTRRIFLPLPFVLLAARPAPPAVMATFSVLADITREVGADAVAVQSLVGPDQDVHEYEPRPADLRRITDAAVLVENGLGLEGWMARLANAAGFHGQRIIASADVTPLRLPGTTQTDPHAWQDPRNGVLYARTIAAGLARALPDAASAIQARAARYVARIDATDQEISRIMGTIPPQDRRLITSHDAFGYFAARYGITMIGVQGIDTEAEPSARDIAQLVAQIRREHIRAVFVENITDPRLARQVAQESGAVVGPPVYSDALSPPGGPAATYLGMLRYNATAFATAQRPA